MTPFLVGFQFSKKNNQWTERFNGIKESTSNNLNGNSKIPGYRTQDLFNCKCRKQDNGLEESKSNTHKTGWAFRRFESKIKEFQ